MRRQDKGSRLLACALAALLAAPATFAAPPMQAPSQTDDADLLAATDALKPGQFEWQPGWDADNKAPVMLMVSLDQQRAYVYRDGQRIGTTTVSTGKPGHETPTGVFEILQKQKLHHSNLYENDRTGAPAPMPWMQRLTWDGVALHAGHVRAKPASHGCVRLPAEFAKQLYTITRTGSIVVIARNGSVQELSLAGVKGPLSALLRSADSLRQITRNLIADEPSGGEGSRGSTFSP